MSLEDRDLLVFWGFSVIELTFVGDLHFIDYNVNIFLSLNLLLLFQVAYILLDDWSSRWKSGRFINAI